MCVCVCVCGLRQIIILIGIDVEGKMSRKNAITAWERHLIQILWILQIFVTIEEVSIKRFMGLGLNPNKLFLNSLRDI